MRRRAFLIRSFVVVSVLAIAWGAWHAQAMWRLTPARNDLADAWPSLDELRGPPVPDDQNAALVYQQASAALDLPPDDREVLDAGADTEAMARIIGRNAAALALIERAAGMGACRFEWRRNDDGDAVPDLANIGDLARVVRARARFAAETGDAAAAGRNLALAARIVEQALEGRGGLLGYRYATGQLAALAPLAGDVLANVDLPPAAAARLRDRLSSVRLAEPLTPALQMEVATILQWIEVVRQHPEWIVPYSFPEAPGEEDLRALLERVGPTWPWLRFVYAMRGRYIELAVETGGLTALPYRELAQLPRPEERRSYLDGLAAAWLWSPERCSERRDRAQLSVTLVLVALDLRDYRRAHGSYPDTLDALPGGGDPDYALDPFTGERLRYERRGAGFWLWSFGPDLDSDNGLRFDELPRPRSDRDNCDISFRLER